MTGEITRYAKWNPKDTYTLTYDGNGKTGGSEPEAVTNESGTTFHVAGYGTLTNKGYSFIEWNTERDGSDESYKADSTLYTIGEVNDTLYVLWKINLYTVTYDGNCSDVENVPNSTTREYDTDFSLSGAVPTCIGHTLNTWKTERGVDYDPGDPLRIPDADVKHYCSCTYLVAGVINALLLRY